MQNEIFIDAIEEVLRDADMLTVKRLQSKFCCIAQVLLNLLF